MFDYAVTLKVKKELEGFTGGRWPHYKETSISVGNYAISNKNIQRLFLHVDNYKYLLKTKYPNPSRIGFATWKN